MLVTVQQLYNGNKAIPYHCMDRLSRRYEVLAYPPAVEGSFDLFLFFFFFTTLTSVTAAGADDCSLPFSCADPLLPWNSPPFFTLSSPRPFSSTSPKFLSLSLTFSAPLSSSFPSPSRLITLLLPFFLPLPDFPLAGCETVDVSRNCEGPCGNEGDGNTWGERVRGDEDWEGGRVGEDERAVVWV